MTEFEKIKDAAEEIKLDDLQKQKILEACKGKKRRKTNFAALAATAAILIISVAVFSPGFLMKAGSDMAQNEAAADDMIVEEEAFDILCDEDVKVNYSASSNGETKYYITDEYTQSLFDTNEFRLIYSSIPQSFISLVDSAEFAEWSETVSAEDGMAIVQFVRHFGVSEEAFDEANRNYAKYISAFYGVLPLYRTPFEEHESFEIFNVELIYSFDKEKIDEYYTSMPKKESGMGSAPAEIIVPEEYYK